MMLFQVWPSVGILFLFLVGIVLYISSKPLPSEDVDADVEELLKNAGP
jgi:hypothetical protein